MTSHLRAPLAMPAVFLSGLLALAPAQEEPPRPAEPDPEVAAGLKVLRDAVADRRFRRDAEAVGTLDELLQKYLAGMHEKDERAFVGGVRQVLTKGKLRPPQHTGLYHAAVTVLGRMGPAGSSALKSVYASRRFPDKEAWLPMRALMLRNLARSGDPAMAKFLWTELRRAKSAVLIAAASEALGEYGDADPALRKEAVGNLLSRYAEIAMGAAKSDDPRNEEAQRARDVLAVVSDSLNTTLGRLTGESYRTWAEWDGWWRKHRKETWR